MCVYVCIYIYIFLTNSEEKQNSSIFSNYFFQTGSILRQLLPSVREADTRWKDRINNEDVTTGRS